MKKKLFYGFLSLIVANSAYSYQGSWSDQGEVAFEFRQFASDNNSSTEDYAMAFFSRLESRYELNNFEAVARGYARADQRDQNRNVVILEDANVSYRFGAEDNWRVLAGYKIFNWTATEAFHPVDVINSKNIDSDLENWEKRGELTLELDWDVLGGTFSAYYWPRYERPIFPGVRSRLGFGEETLFTPILDPVYLDDDSSDHYGTQWGARFERTIADADLSFHYIDHMDRNFPIIGNSDFISVPLIVHPSGLAPADLTTMTIPYYYRVVQIGGTVQWALGSFLLKFEGASRKFKTNDQVLTQIGNSRVLRNQVDHGEYAFGVEYGLAHDSGSESFFFFELNTITGTTEEERAALSPFQRDIFLGYRLALNDISSSDYYFGMIMDMERSSEFFYTLRYSQRLGNTWRASTGIRLYDAAPKQATPVGMEVLDGDGQFFFKLSRFF